MTVRIITGPTVEPITLAEAKLQLRLRTADTEDDDMIEDLLIPAARQWAEEYLNRGIILQVVELLRESFADSMELPRGNLSAMTSYPDGVVSVKYLDSAGVEQTLATTHYDVAQYETPGRVTLAYNYTWPTVYSQFDAVRIRYGVGWPIDEVPAPIKQAMLLLISQMYEHRVPEVTGTIVSQIQFAAEALLASYRIYTV